MHKKILFLILINICTKAFAHNPQVSTISIIQQENKKWSVFITAPLSTFQMAIVANFPTLNIDSLDVYAIQNIIPDLLRNNLIINESENINLINKKIQVAHETTIYFELSDTSSIRQIKFTTFSKLTDHFTLFKIVPLNKKEITYILNSDNNYVFQLNQSDNKIKINYSIVFEYLLVALFILPIFYFMIKKFNNKRRKKLDKTSNL